MRQVLNFPLEIKAISEREFEGYGSTFGNVDHGGDIVMRGSFKRSLAEHRKAGSMPLMFWMHDPAQVPGVWTEMREDDDGLFVRGELVDTQLGNETRTLLLKKAVRGLSIGYVPRDVDYDDDGNRLIKEIDLWEVSVVSLAMNPLAQIQSAKARLSGAGEYVPTKREFEKMLRGSGYSLTVAKALCAKVFDDHDELPPPRPDDGEAGVVASLQRLRSVLTPESKSA
jgi:uncharacterized protein